MTSANTDAATRSATDADPGRGDDRPDTTYAFAVGLYAAALLGPAAVLVASPWVESAAGLYVALLVATAGVAVAAGWLAARTPELGVRVGGWRAAWLLVVAPLAWFAGAFGAPAVGVEPPDVAAVLAMLGSVGGTFAGFVVVAMSRTRYADAATAGATELAEWEARWPENWRRASVAAVLASVVLGAAGVVAEYWFGVDGAAAVYWLTLFTIPMATPTSTPRTFHVTDAGLVVERPHQRRFRPWSAYAGYELTDDALVVDPAAWWRPAHRCDRADVDDVGAAVDALDRTFDGGHRGR